MNSVFNSYYSFMPSDEILLIEWPQSRRVTQVNQVVGKDMNNDSCQMSV